MSPLYPNLGDSVSSHSSFFVPVLEQLSSFVRTDLTVVGQFINPQKSHLHKHTPRVHFLVIYFNLNQICIDFQVFEHKDNSFCWRIVSVIRILSYLPGLNSDPSAF